MSAIDEIMRAVHQHAELCHAAESDWAVMADHHARDDACAELRDLIAAAIADALREGAEQMREAAAALCKAKADREGSKAMETEDDEPDMVDSLKATAWDFMVMESYIRILPLPTGPRQAAKIERLQHQADQADQIDVSGIVDALSWMGVSTPEGGTEAAAARLGRLVNDLSAAVLRHKIDHRRNREEIERLKACAPMSPATAALGEIVMRWREQGDGLYAVDLTTCNLTSESMAHAAMAHLESLFAGGEIKGRH